MLASFRPRLLTSRQWSSLPTEFAFKVRDVFAKQFDDEAKLGQFVVDGRIYASEITVRVGYLESGRLQQINFEASMDLLPDGKSVSALETEDPDLHFAKNENQTMKLLYVCIDAIGSLMEEYFDVGGIDEMDVPNTWRAYEIEGETVYLQYSTVNTQLEAEADRLLGMSSSDARTTGLYNEDPLSEDALSKAEIDSDLTFSEEEHDH